MTAPLAGPGPLAGADLWREVVGAARGWCQCTGQCGRKHRKSAGGRCDRFDSPDRPLRAVPRDPGAAPAVAVRLPPKALTALCGPCADGRDRQHRQTAARAAQSAQAAAPGLFDAGEVAS